MILKDCNSFPKDSYIFYFSFKDRDDLLWHNQVDNYLFTLVPTKILQPACPFSHNPISENLGMRAYIDFQSFCNGWADQMNSEWASQYGGSVTHLGSGYMKVVTPISAFNSYNFFDLCTNGLSIQCNLNSLFDFNLSNIKPDIFYGDKFCCKYIEPPIEKPCDDEEKIIIPESCQICDKVLIKWYYKEPNDTDFVFRFEEDYNGFEITNTLQFTERGKYQIKAEVCNCCGCCSSIINVNVGSPVLLYRKSPNVFILNDIRDFTNVYRNDLILYDDNMSKKLYETSINPYTGKDIEITVSEDGVYYLISTIYQKVGNDWILKETNKFCIFEISSIIRCYMNYVTDILCFSESDYCNNTVKQYEMNELNKFLALSISVISVMFVKYNQSDGIFEYKLEDIDFYNNGAKYIRQMLKYCNKCTDSHVLKPISKPCISCKL